MVASQEHPVAGLDLVELTISPQAFSALRRYLSLGQDVAGVYDVFPIVSSLDDSIRKAAAQFLAAERLWALDEAGALAGVPLSFKLALPRGWNKAPMEVRQRLGDVGALDLSEAAISTFRDIKAQWEKLREG